METLVRTLPSKSECLRAAGVILGRAVDRILASTPREAAETAFQDGGPSIEELERRVIEFQAKWGANQ